jgi:hypothetical protein
MNVAPAGGYSDSSWDGCHHPAGLPLREGALEGPGVRKRPIGETGVRRRTFGPGARVVERQNAAEALHTRAPDLL